MSRAIRSLLIITILSVATLSFSSAYFSDTETSAGNVLSAGSIDLKINDLDNPDAIVSFQDLKPGDDHIVPKRLRVIDNDAYVWMHIVSYESSQGIQTEPEIEEETANGEQSDIENYIYYDLGFDSETEIISLADQIRFPDAVSCWVPLGILTGGQEYTLNQSFHFDEDVTNWAQGDDLTFIEEFYAVQTRNNPNPAPPISESGRVWNPETSSCEDGECEEALVYADSVEESNQALRKNGTPVLASRSNPNATLGAPDGNGNANTGFYSLGYGGSITVEFAAPVGDGAGADISIHEITLGRNTYPLESAEVEVSANGSDWFSIGTATSQSSLTGVALLDISTNPLAPAQVKFVRITDTTIAANNPDPNSDGFDLDAINAVYGDCSIQ